MALGTGAEECAEVGDCGESASFQARLLIGGEIEELGFRSGEGGIGEVGGGVVPRRGGQSTECFFGLAFAPERERAIERRARDGLGTRLRGCGVCFC